MSQSIPTRSITFIDEDFNWKRDTLMDFLYKFENVPMGYEDFFFRKDVVPVIETLSRKLFEAAQTATIFPLMENTFKALRCKEPKVVLLGQDPYHNPDPTNSKVPGSAMGLAFSLPVGSTHINPSFQSIQKEVARNGFAVNTKSGDLTRWVDQGVILLNTALTVEKGDAGSHTEIWAPFTEKLIEYLSENHRLTWLLWGGPAHTFESSIKNRDNQYIIKTSHPMPLAASRPSGGNPPFFGSEFCVKTNKWLRDQGRSEIDWKI